MTAQYQAMTEAQARDTLGLAVDCTLTSAHKHSRQFKKTILRKQAFVENSPSPETKARYERELKQYQEAVDLILSLADPPHKGGAAKPVAFVLTLALITTTAWWSLTVYQDRLGQEELARQHQIEQIQAQEEAATKRQQIVKLEAVGKQAVATRKWRTATSAFQEILAIDPDSASAAKGLADIELGKRAETKQKIHFTLGNSQTAMEAGQWDEAVQLAQSVLDRHPDNKQAQLKLKIIAEQRRLKEVEAMVNSIAKHLDSKQIAEAQKKLIQLNQKAPSHSAIVGFKHQIAALLVEIQNRQQKAEKLLAQAQALDDGNYSAQAIAWLDEAMRLDSGNPVIPALHEKMSRYTRTLSVPQDFPSISDALASARPRDRIVLSPGIYAESVRLEIPVRIEGSPEGGSILELPATESALMTITPTASGSLLSNLTLRHKGFDLDQQRSSALIIQGAKVTINACRVEGAAGHGIAVIAGAQATITGCKVSRSGWDGISVYGKGSRADVLDSYSQENLHHGVEFWKGGYGKVSNSRILANGLCGVLAMSPGTQVEIKTTLCGRNRSAGILISDGVAAKLLAVRCDGNLLSGVAARGHGTAISVINSVANSNKEAGILVYSEVQRHEFSDNKAAGNKHRQIWLDARSALLKK